MWTCPGGFSTRKHESENNLVLSPLYRSGTSKEVESYSYLVKLLKNTN